MEKVRELEYPDKKKNQLACETLKVRRRRQKRKAFFSRPAVYIACGIVILFITAALCAELVMPYNPNETDLSSSMNGPSPEHWLGCDNYGRDVLTRIVYGARVSLMVGVVTVLISACFGIAVGMAAGYFGGVADAIIMRLCETVRAIPMVVLAVALSIVFGKGVLNLCFILAISGCTQFIQVMRGQVLQIKNSDYVTVRKVTGCSPLRIMIKHILPNAISPMIVLTTQSIGSTILIETGLSFLGIGIKAPTPAWGGMINDGRIYLTTDPLMSLAPGICIVLLVLSLNILGDALRDMMDPHLNGAL